MPTVTPADDGVPDFNSLISEQLANLENGLTVGFERIALERENGLRAENKQLQQENKELRAKLKQAEIASSSTLPSEHEAGLVSKLAGGALQALSNAANSVEASAAAAEAVIAEDLAKMTQGLALEANSDVSVSAIALKSKTDPTATHSFTVPSFALLPEYAGDSWMMNSLANDDEVDAGYCSKSATPHVIQKAPAGVVDPSSSTRLCWDLIGIPVLSWDLITIPMGVYTMGSRGDDVMAGAGWVTLIYWTIDMPCTFLTGYFDSDGNVVMSHKDIARQYLHGFFGLDLTIVVADWLSVIMEAISSGGGGGFLANVSVLRIFRITRFARLLRLKKLKAKIQTIEDSIQSEWWLVIMGLTGKVASILMINHYVSCLWFWVGSQDAFGGPRERWTTALPYPQYDSDGKFDEAPWAFQYLTSLHWAIAQFTPGPQNIQPQNCVERIFAVIVLLFGLVIFSSFIAGVTQARMQLNKMMSKLDRDLWVLRKFCQQNKVSRELNMRMKRYVDLVIVPNYHKLTQADVVLIPKLSAHLRAQLKNELMSQIICVHPFFDRLRRWYDNVMNVVSQTCIENTPLASGDVAFGHGQVATRMHIVTKGVLDYLPGGSRETVMKLEKGRWISEAALWTKWVHQGQLQASIESSSAVIDSSNLRREIVKNGLAMGFVRKYSQEFLQRLNKMAQDQGCHPSDIHDDITADIAIGSIPVETRLGVLPKF